MITKRKENLFAAAICFIFSLTCLYILLFKPISCAPNEPQIYATAGITFLINSLVALFVMGWACLTDKVKLRPHEDFSKYDEVKINFYLPMLFMPTLVMVSLIVYTRANSLLFKILWSGIFIYLPYVTIKYRNFKEKEVLFPGDLEIKKGDMPPRNLSIKELVIGIAVNSIIFLALVYGTRYFDLPTGLTASLLMFLGFTSLLIWNYKKFKFPQKVAFGGLAISSAILSLLWAYKEFINPIRIDLALIIILIGAPLFIGSYLMKKEKDNEQ